jgi:hypothetical protein
MTSKLKLEVSTVGRMTTIPRTTLHVVSTRGVVLIVISVRENIVAGILLMQLVLLRRVRRWVAILEQFLLENTAVCMIADTNVKYLNVYTERRREVEEVSASDVIQERISSCMLENTNSRSVKYLNVQIDRKLDEVSAFDMI